MRGGNRGINRSGSHTSMNARSHSSPPVVKEQTEVLGHEILDMMHYYP
jgi:hypothetical protein